jgi:polyhydroxyalkanoate synthase
MKTDKKRSPEDLLNPMKMAWDLILAKMAVDSAQALKRMRKAKDVLLGPLNTEIAPTPYDIVYEEDRVKLKHYKPVTDIKYKTPLLVTYAMVNRETMLDLQQGRSVVQRFLDAGIDLYMIDWWYPTRKDRYLTIDDHVNGYMDNIVDFILDRTGHESLNLMGICMGGTYSIMYAALHPEKIKNLVLTVTPSNFDTDQGLLNVWSRSIDVDAMVESYGNIPGDILNLAFLLMNPPRLMVDKYVGFIENVHDRDFVENFVRMERWIFDSPDLPGETFRQFIKELYHQNLLIQNKMELDGKRIDLKKITMPVLNIYAKYDHLVPPEACEFLTKKIGSRDKEDVCLDTGHIGIYVSSKTQKEFAPKIISWLKERDGAGEGKTSKAPVKKQRKGTGKTLPKTKI